MALKVEWSFLLSVLKCFDFNNKWFSWIKECICSLLSQFNQLQSHELLPSYKRGLQLTSGDPPILLILIVLKSLVWDSFTKEKANAIRKSSSQLSSHFSSYDLMVLGKVVLKKKKPFQIVQPFINKQKYAISFSENANLRLQVDLKNSFCN